LELSITVKISYMNRKWASQLRWSLPDSFSKALFEVMTDNKTGKNSLDHKSLIYTSSQESRKNYSLLFTPTIDKSAELWYILLSATLRIFFAVLCEYGLCVLTKICSKWDMGGRRIGGVNRIGISGLLGKITFLVVTAFVYWLCIGPSALAGSIVGWGWDHYGQSTPPDGNDFVSITAGVCHNLALKSDGSIVGWGGDYVGQATPPDGNDFVAIAAGVGHSLALKSDGSIVAWGGDFLGLATPPDGNNFVAITAGSYFSLALKSDGSIVGWGGDYVGQATPPDGNDFVAIAGGGAHSLALKSDGSIIAWGNNDDGRATPPDGNDFVAIAAGGAHGLALKSDGSIVGWGWNRYGQATPPAGNDFVAIAGGGAHSLALKSDGSIIGWGISDGGPYDFGQVTGTPSGNNYLAIAAGYNHSLAIRCQPPIEAKMKFTPKVLNCNSRGKWFKAHFVLPEDITVEDVDSHLLGEIDSIGIEADYMDVFVDEDGLVRVDMTFDRTAFCDALTDGGSIEITVIGFLTNCQYFYGTDFITMK